MSDNYMPPPLKTASELWQRLVNDGTLIPHSYDSDVVDLLDGLLPGSGTLAHRMNIAEWTPRDLLRAISPVLDSLAGLLFDLLNLYSDIAAKYGTRENLIVAYEFKDGDTFDQSLTQFRSALKTLRKAQNAKGSFIVSPVRREYPSTKNWKIDIASIQSMRDGDYHNWRFTLPTPPKSDDAAITRAISLIYSVLNASCDTLKQYGSTMYTVGNSSVLWSPAEGESLNHSNLYYDFTDFFPEAVIKKLHADLKYLESSSTTQVHNWLRRVEKWCSSFWDETTYDAESALVEMLSLPTWGKRHELYSAWVVCVIANAFNGQHLSFEVVDGRLSFPFKGTKIASFEDRTGPVELWAEVRSAASGTLTHGRRYAVQPDYRFLRPGQKTSDTDMAIEAKHYRRAAGSRHGDTARDYARALPRARIAVVAQGPIGKTAINRVDTANRNRVSFHEGVRSLISVETDTLISELTSIFPPAAPKITIVQVVSSAVNEVEIHAIRHEYPNRSVVLGRNSDSIALTKSGNAELILEIVCHPERRHTIDTSKLMISITYADGEVRNFVPRAPIPSTRWHIGTLRSASFIGSDETLERTE